MEYANIWTAQFDPNQTLTERLIRIEDKLDRLLLKEPKKSYPTKDEEMDNDTWQEILRKNGLDQV